MKVEGEQEVTASWECLCVTPDYSDDGPIVLRKRSAFPQSGRQYRMYSLVHNTLQRRLTIEGVGTYTDDDEGEVTYI